MAKTRFLLKASLSIILLQLFSSTISAAQQGMGRKPPGFFDFLLVCPIGLHTHAIEQISLFRISLKKSACTGCGVCKQTSPCKAIPEIMKGAALRPDCFACSICIECSPSKALNIGTRRITDQ